MKVSLHTWVHCTREISRLGGRESISLDSIKNMANKKHIEILMQGKLVWNQWRKENPEIHPDLSQVIINDTPPVRLAENLGIEDLSETNLSYTCLDGSYLRGVDLREANLSYAKLRETDLRRSNLRRANLSQAQLNLANLTLANLIEVNFTETLFWETILARTSLGGAFGLKTCKHGGPSVIDQRTIRKSGNLPIEFLRGCGLEDWQIELTKLNQPHLSSGKITDILYKAHDLLVNNPVNYGSCFISYSSKDTKFAKKLYQDLQENGIRCWFAPQSLLIGAKIRQSIDEAIQVYEKLLVIISKNSAESEWVEDEFEAAIEKERQTKNLVLIPIAIDETVYESKVAWVSKIR